MQLFIYWNSQPTLLASFIKNLILQQKGFIARSIELRMNLLPEITRKGEEELVMGAFLNDIK